jgi:hypothetical protein
MSANEDRGRPRVTYTLSQDIVDWLEAEAKRTGHKMSHIVENALRLEQARKTFNRMINKETRKP